MDNNAIPNNCSKRILGENKRTLFFFLSPEKFKTMEKKEKSQNNDHVIYIDAWVLWEWLAQQ